MSRGPGKWQRLILRSVEKTDDWLFLDDLLPPASLYIRKYQDRWLNRACSDSEGLRRAARNLSRRGEIEYDGRHRKNVAPFLNRYRAAVRRLSKCCPP